MMWLFYILVYISLGGGYAMLITEEKTEWWILVLIALLWPLCMLYAAFHFWVWVGRCARCAIGRRREKEEAP